MSAIIDQMRVLSYGKVGPYTGRTSSSSDQSPTGNLPAGSITPSRRVLSGNLGELDSMIDQATYWGERFNAARSHRDKLLVVDRARDALERITKSQADMSIIEETLGELHTRLVDGDPDESFRPEGWPARDVANHYRTSVKIVWAARIARRCDPETGRSIAKVNVVELKAKGMTVRQLATLAGISKSEVHRQIQAAA